jgi:arylsulfatase
MLGSRALWHHGWKVTSDHVGQQLTVEREQVAGSHSFDQDHWALFRLDDDPAEANDVGAEHPEVLRRLVDMWWVEAGRNQVLPLEDSFIGRAVALEPSPWGFRGKADLAPGGGPVCETLLPPMGGGFPGRGDRTGRRRSGDHGARRLARSWATSSRSPTVAISLFGDVVRLAGSEPRAGASRSSIGAPPAGRPIALCIDGTVVARATVPIDLPSLADRRRGLLVGRDRAFR